MKDKTYKTLIIAALVVAIGGLSLGYAALTQVLNISTTATVQSADKSWRIRFENPSTGVVTGSAEAGTIGLSDTDVTLSGVQLKAPGDTVSYTFDVHNAGELDAQLSTITMKNPKVQGTGDSANADATLVSNNFYNYTLTYSDGSSIAIGDTLASGETKTIKLTISIDSSVTTLPTGDVTIQDLGCTLTYVQQ